METELAILALLVAGYALIAARLDRLSVGPALAFMAIGILLADDVLGPISFEPQAEPLKVVAEATLTLLLFADASTIRARALRQDAAPVARLLIVGLPLTIVLGTAAALLLFPGTPLGIALLIGAALAPTDAALGQPVVTNPIVPARIRRMLSLESGLNDGIATPFVFLALALSTAEATSGSGWLVEALTETTIGVVSGVVVGFAGGSLLRFADRRRWTSTVARGSRWREEGAVRFTETQGSLLAIGVWIAFGLTLAGRLLTDLWDPRAIAYAVLSLTVIRLLPVGIALAGTRFSRSTVLFVGWFGPRGLASIVFLIVGLEGLQQAGVDPGPFGAAVAWTVLLSVIAHGLSAGPIAARYGRRTAELPPDAPEHEDSIEPKPARVPWAGERPMGPLA